MGWWPLMVSVVRNGTGAVSILANKNQMVASGWIKWSQCVAHVILFQLNDHPVEFLMENHIQRNLVMKPHEVKNLCKLLKFQ